jgi:hypothetical protein
MMYDVRAMYAMYAKSFRFRVLGFKMIDFWLSISGFMSILYSKKKHYLFLLVFKQQQQQQQQQQQHTSSSSSSSSSFDKK